MAKIAIPTMTRPWKVAAAVMASFAFVTGYVASAGAPFCGSLGTCLALAVDRGIEGFEPAALIPGVIGAVLFAAAVNILFFIVHGVRNGLHPKRSAENGKSHTAQPTATVRNGQRQWPKPTPLLVAVGAALAWGVLSVGPGTLADDLRLLTPTDTVTAPFCLSGSKRGSSCATLVPGTPASGGLLNPSDFPTVSLTDPVCISASEFQVPVPAEADGMCHDRSGGTIEPLMYDLGEGGKSGLLAFLAVGAALVLWPRLRASSVTHDRQTA